MAPDSIELRAHAKVNLHLKILGSRPDGFHEIESLISPIELHDVIRMAPAQDGIVLHCTGLEEPVPTEKNLAYKAAALFLERTGMGSGVEIWLEKHVPSGAGLGGGSSDAAAVLHGMNVLFNKRAQKTELLDMASRLGSDVPFFVDGRQARVRGRGEVVEPLEEPEPIRPIVLVKPAFGVSTVWAYKAWDELQKTGAAALTEQSGSAKSNPPSPPGKPESGGLFNDLEECVFSAHPGLRAVKAALIELGADGALMSGSGSTVFGLFADAERAGKAAEVLRATDPSWKVTATRLLPSTW